MATTIVTKNGSGAPAAGDLVQGELAVDLTNQTLYSKDSSGNVFKVGDTGGGSPGTFTDLVATDSFTSPGIDDNATSTAITIDGNQRVGIGTDVPDGKLNVFSASAGNVSADADADELVLENSGNVGLSLLTASTGESSIYFGNPGSGGQKDFSLKYYHESHPDTAKRRSFTFNNPSKQLMCVNNSGNVGIGTDVPANNLHIHTEAGDEGILIKSTGNTSNAIISDANRSSAGAAITNFQGKWDGTTVADMLLLTGADTTNKDDGVITFRTSSADNITERMRIDSSGNVGIGATSVDSSLHIETATPRITLQIDGNSGYNTIESGGNNELIFGRTGTERMRIASSGNVGIGADPQAKFHVATPVNNGVLVTSTDRTTFKGIAYNTNDNQFTVGTQTNHPLSFYTNDTEHARIDTSGNLLVGRTNVATVNDPSASLNADGSVYSSVAAGNSYHLYNTTTGAYTFYITSGGNIHAGSNVITVLSDERLKENIRDLDDGLDKIMALQPRKFDWKEGKGQDHADARGFIAQELEVVFPDMVNDDGLNLDEDGESYKTITPNLIPTLVKAMQEQQAMIKTLQAEVAALKGA